MDRHGCLLGASGLTSWKDCSIGGLPASEGGAASESPVNQASESHLSEPEESTVSSLSEEVQMVYGLVHASTHPYGSVVIDAGREES